MQGRNLKDYLALILRVDAKNFSTVEDFYQRNAYFFKPVIHSRRRDSSIHGIPLIDLARPARMISEVDVHSWDATSLHGKIAEAATFHTTAGTVADNSPLGAEDKSLHASQRAFSKALHSYLRWALAEGMPGPGIGHILAILGRSVSQSRLSHAADSVREQSAHSHEAEVSQLETLASR